jgi:hypothetical protein
MPPSLSAHLRGLSTADFEALLQRRIEVKTYLGGQWRRDMGTLADLLAKPYAIHEAVASLNSFLAQLLQLAVWLGPRVTAAELAAHAPEVSLEDLRTGAEELSRWGLAFIDTKGAPADGGWALELPACTLVAVPMPVGFGPLARRLLAHRSIHFLATLSRNLGLPTGPRPDKESIVAEVSVALAEPERVLRLLEEAEPKAGSLFAVIQEHGGMIGRRELMATGHVRWSDPPWSERRKILTPLDWLESRGLVIHDESEVYSGAAVIPAEVELALRGGRLFGSWQVEAPPLPLMAVPGADHPGDPSRALGDLEAVLDEWAQTPPACLQKGGLGVRELKKTAKTLGFGERYVSFLYALAVEAQLVGVDDENRIGPSPIAVEWAADPPPQRWSALLGSWIGATLWTEDNDGLVPVDKVVRMDWLAHIRASVTSELAALPPGTGTDVASLAARIAWRFPSRFASTEAAVELVERAVEALAWLGTATGRDPIAVVEPARSAARDGGWATGRGPGAMAFAAEVSTCTVGADLNVIVPGPPVHDLASALRRFADLKASSPARIYKLSEASVRRALDGGMQASEIMSLLERHSTTDIPQNVAYLIEDVARRHGHLVAGRSGLYLRSDDPALLRAAVADRRLTSMRPRLIAPTVAVLDANDVEVLLTALRMAGYLPIAEPGGGSLQAGSQVGDGDTAMHRLLRPSEPELGLSPDEASALAATLRRGPGTAAAGPAAGGRPADLVPARLAGLVAPVAGLRDLRLLDGRTAETPNEIQQLLELAVDHWMVVEIMYISQDGRRSTREIEPIEVSRVGVDAWCRLREDERHFLLPRIRWARATGERFVELPEGGDTAGSSAGEESLDLR